MTPDEELEQLDAELERLQSEHPNTPGILRLTDTCLRDAPSGSGNSSWTPSDGEVWGITNGNDRERRDASCRS